MSGSLLQRLVIRHVKKYNSPTVGVADDNIYTWRDTSRGASPPFGEYMIGTVGTGGQGAGVMYDANIGADDKDSYLGN